jgi:hypothetical protein
MDEDVTDFKLLAREDTLHLVLSTSNNSHPFRVINFINNDQNIWVQHKSPIQIYLEVKTSTWTTVLIGSDIVIFVA